MAFLSYVVPFDYSFRRRMLYDNWMVDMSFKVLNMNESAGVFLKPLENCISLGKPFLFGNVDKELDPTIDPILEKNFIIKAGMKIIKLCENIIDYNDDFRLYFTTKLANPKCTPEICQKLWSQIIQSIFTWIRQ